MPARRPARVRGRRAGAEWPPQEIAARLRREHPDDPVMRVWACTTGSRSRPTAPSTSPTPEPLATRLEREQQGSAASVLPQGRQPPHAHATRPRRPAQRPTQRDPRPAPQPSPQRHTGQAIRDHGVCTRAQRPTRNSGANQRNPRSAPQPLRGRSRVTAHDLPPESPHQKRQDITSTVGVSTHRLGVTNLQ